MKVVEAFILHKTWNLSDRTIKEFSLSIIQNLIAEPKRGRELKYSPPTGIKNHVYQDILNLQNQATS